MANPKFDETEEIAPKFDDTEELSLELGEPSIEEPSQLEALGRGALEGASFGLTDEIGAGIRAVPTWIGEQMRESSTRDILDKQKADMLAQFEAKRQAAQMVGDTERVAKIEATIAREQGKDMPVSEASSFGDIYRDIRDVTRERKKEVEEAHPGTFLAGEVVGGIASGGAVGSTGKVIGKKAITEAAKVGAKFGGAQALGRTEADLTKGEFVDAAKDVAGGIAGGAIIGGSLQKVGTGIRKAVSKQGRKQVYDVLPKTIKKVVDAVKESSKGRPMLGGKVQDTNLDKADNLANTMRNFLNKVAKKSAQKDVQGALGHKQTIKMTNKLDGYIKQLNNERSKFNPDMDEYKTISGAIKQLNNQKEKFLTNEIKHGLPTKGEAIAKLQGKIDDITFTNEMGTPEAKAIDNLFNRVAKMGKKGFKADEVDVDKIVADFNLPDRNAAIEMMKEIATLSIKKPIVNKKTGLISEIPKEFVAVVKKFKPSAIEEVEGRAFFRHGPKIVSEKFQQEAMYSPVEMLPQEVYNVQKQLYDLVNSSQLPAAKSAITKVAKSLRSDILESLPEDLAKKFEKGMSKYSDVYQISELLGSKGLLEKADKVKITKALSDTASKIRDFTPYAGIAQEEGRTIRKAGIEALERVSPKFSKLYQKKALDIGKMTDLNRAGEEKGLGALGSTIEAVGVRGGALIGKYAVKPTKNVARKLSDFANLGTDKLTELASDPKIIKSSPKLANLMKNLSESKSDTSRRALLFSASQNPDLRKGIAELLGLNIEEGNEDLTID